METELPRSIPTGQLINGRYEVVSHLAEGGMGSIVLVRDRHLKNSLVVLKFLHIQYTDDEQQFERFRNEAQLMRDLSHPNIVRVYDINAFKDKRYYISMEYVDGSSLRQEMRRSKSNALPFKEAVSFLMSVARGMSYAHSKGIVHRDLKPDNVLLGKNGEVKVADFGLAKALLREENLTMDGEAVGTPHYMAPEQIQGLELDHRCDIYAFGIMAYELVTGEKPFTEENYLKLVEQHFYDRVPAIKTRGTGIPAWFNHFVALCTKKERDARLQTFDDILLLLETFKGGYRASFSRNAIMLKLSLLWAAQGTRVAAGLLFFLILFLIPVLPLTIGRFSPGFRMHYMPMIVRVEQVSGVSLGAIKRFGLPNHIAEFTEYDPLVLVGAIRYGRTEAVKILLAAGLSPSVQDVSGQTALSAAIEHDNPELISLLLAEYPREKIDLADSGGRTALHYALQNGNAVLVGELLKLGASLFQEDSQGNTALLYAVRSGNHDLVRHVLQAGLAQVRYLNKANNSGQTVLDFAKRNSTKSIISTLEESGAQSAEPSRKGRAAR